MRTIHKKSRDPQRVYPVAECALCGGELYPGDACWRLAGQLFCEDCVIQWVLEELSFCRMRLREVGQ